jgi:hypothetical protein
MMHHFQGFQPCQQWGSGRLDFVPSFPVRMLPQVAWTPALILATIASGNFERPLDGPGEASWPALRWASQSFLSWANQSWDKIGVERLIEHLLLIWQMKTIFLVFYIGSLGSM